MPRCGSLDNIKWGIREWVKRYKCRSCGSLFSSRRKDISISDLDDKDNDTDISSDWWDILFEWSLPDSLQGGESEAYAVLPVHEIGGRWRDSIRPAEHQVNGVCYCGHHHGWRWQHNTSCSICLSRRPKATLRGTCATRIPALDSHTLLGMTSERLISIWKGPCPTSSHILTVPESLKPPAP